MRTLFSFCPAAGALILLVLPAATDPHLPQVQVRVTVDKANARESPSGTARVVRVLRRGETFVLSGDSGHWYELQLEEGHQAYVGKQLCEVVLGLAPQSRGEAPIGVADAEPSKEPSHEIAVWLLAASATLLVGLLAYIITTQWKNWDGPWRVAGILGLVIVALLGFLTYVQIEDRSFLSGFLANYVVATALFVLTYFAADRFIEVQRNRAMFSTYLPAVIHELLQNSASLARSLALTKRALIEGYESTIDFGPIGFEPRAEAWQAFRSSGNVARLPLSRNRVPDTLRPILAEVHSEISRCCAFTIDTFADPESLVSWSDSLPSDVARLHELMSDAHDLMRKTEMVRVSKAMVGRSLPSLLQNPHTAEEKEFANAYRTAQRFCKAATDALVLSCYVISQLRSLTTVRHQTRQRTVAATPAEIVHLVLSSVPKKFRRQPAS